MREPWTRSAAGTTRRNAYGDDAYICRTTETAPPLLQPLVGSELEKCVTSESGPTTMLNRLPGVVFPLHTNVPLAAPKCPACVSVPWNVQLRPVVVVVSASPRFVAFCVIVMVAKSSKVPFFEGSAQPVCVSRMPPRYVPLKSSNVMNSRTMLLLTDTPFTE